MLKNVSPTADLIARAVISRPKNNTNEERMVMPKAGCLLSLKQTHILIII
jgi:hypothetical protein